MAYVATTWVNRDKDQEGTKLNADNLNHIEEGISTLDTALSNLATTVSGLNLTEEQLALLTNVSNSLKDVQDGLNALSAKFEAHVHSNEAGDVTGPVAIQSDDNTGDAGTTDETGNTAQQ
jgi:hypothetical protein